MNSTLFEHNINNASRALHCKVEKEKYNVIDIEIAEQYGSAIARLRPYETIQGDPIGFQLQLYNEPAAIYNYIEALRWTANKLEDLLHQKENS